MSTPVETYKDHNIYENSASSFAIFGPDDKFYQAVGSVEYAKYTIDARIKHEEQEALNVAENTKKYGNVEAHVAGEYEVGAILVSSWGYEQTNIDYFCIVSRSKAGFVTLLPMEASEIKQEGGMRGTSRAGSIILKAKAFRRKLAITSTGSVLGLSIEHGWCRLWDGKDEHWTAYH